MNYILIYMLCKSHNPIAIYLNDSRTPIGLSTSHKFFKRQYIHTFFAIKTFYFAHCINVLYSSLPLNQDDDVPFMYP